MFIVFGTRGIKHTIKESEILNDSCPNCDRGNLINKLYRRWFTLFFIPVIPLDVVDRFYDRCDGVRRARGRRQNRVVLGKHVVVQTMNDILDIAFSGCG